MIIKKFKNGKIKFQLEKSDLFYYADGNGGIDIYKLYDNEITMSDLYIQQINGYQYIVDFNTNIVYELGSYLMQNPLKFIADELSEGAVYLHPLTKKTSLDLLEDLENGY